MKNSFAMKNSLLLENFKSNKVSNYSSYAIARFRKSKITSVILVKTKLIERIISQLVNKSFKEFYVKKNFSLCAVNIIKTN